MEIEQMDLTDKMSQMHKDMYRTMLGVNELPLFLLRRYFAVKKPLDKIDGFITAPDLLRIAMDVGFNVETGHFESLQAKPVPVEIGKPAVGKVTAEPEKPEKVAEEAAKGMEDMGFKKQEETEQPEPEPELSMVGAKVDEEGRVVQDPPEPEKEPVAPEPEEKPFYPVKTAVSVFLDGGVKNGIVTGFEDGSYFVEIEGETHELSEDEIKA